MKFFRGKAGRILMTVMGSLLVFGMLAGTVAGGMAGH